MLEKLIVHAYIVQVLKFEYKADVAKKETQVKMVSTSVWSPY